MKKFACVFAVLLAVLLFAGAALEQTRLMRARQQWLPVSALTGAPPLMAFTTMALGGFRSLIADVLWLRSIRLQEEGRVFEIMQLADWITKLAPDFTTVWAFQAWNMAYNISVLFPDPATRWRWVHNAIRLLREEGLRFNQRNPNLFKELGWLYQHKIGYFMDSAHWYYKRQLASSMANVLDGSSPNYEDNTQLNRLRDEFKLDPEIMRTIDWRYGPFDWRLPETHSFYWAWRGKTIAPQPDGAGARACAQMLFQSISATFRKGRLEFEPASGLYLTSPRLDLLPHALAVYEETLQTFDLPIFHNAYANFISEAAIIFYCYGELDQAQTLYRKLIDRYGANDNITAFDEFIAASMRAIEHPDFDLPYDDAFAVVEGFLVQAERARAAGDTAQATDYAERARAFRENYMAARSNLDHRLRTGLPDLNLIRAQAERRLKESRP